MDVYDLLEYIDNNIDSNNITDDDLRQWAEKLAAAVFESDDMQVYRGVAAVFMLTRYDNAFKRADVGYKVEQNRQIEERYQKIMAFFGSETGKIPPSIKKGEEALREFKRYIEERKKHLGPQQRSSNPPSRSRGKNITAQQKERERRYFDAAIKAGFMEKTETGYRWIFQKGRQVSLAYFLSQIYNPDRLSKTPFKELEALFNVKHLAKTTYCIDEVNKIQKWRGAIDNLFNEKHP